MTTLSEWTQRMGEQEMPVLAHTAQEITLSSEREDSSSAEIARIILRDSSMTVRVLKLANSSFFNPAGHSSRTITRAVVVLGFDVIKSLCLTVALINALLKDSPQQERVLVLMAQSFHAATQARSLAVACGNRAPEEVYVAALLSRLGEMAFWCFGGDKAKELDELLCTGVNPAEAELKVLGFRLSRLTRSLNQEWKLSPLLGASLDGDKGPLMKQIMLGLELAEKTELGWDDPGVLPVLESMAEEASLPLERMTEIAHRSADQAAQSARDCGASRLVRFLPSPSLTQPKCAEEDEAQAQDLPEPDPLLQLQILREVATLFESRVDVNLLFNMVLEGIHRGIGMERTLLAIVAPDRSRIRAKYTLGQDEKELMQAFHFPLQGSQQDIFSHIMEVGRPLWFAHSLPPDTVRLVTPEITAAIGETSFFAAPLVAQGRAIGLIYSDRKPSGRNLDEESFSSFKHFCQQVNLGLSLVARA